MKRIAVERMPDYSTTEKEKQEGRIWEVVIQESKFYSTIIGSGLSRETADKLATKKRAELEVS